MEDTTDDLEDKARSLNAVVWLVISLAAAVPIIGIFLLVWAL